MKMTAKTVNQMILATLKTKQGAEPKYMDELASAGFSVLPSDYSTQNYLRVGTSDGDDFLVISKNYGNTTALYFNGLSNVVSGSVNIGKVDFENLLRTKPRRRAMSAAQGKDPYEARCGSGGTRVSQYKSLKSKVDTDEWWLGIKEKELEQARKVMEKAEAAYKRAACDLCKSEGSLASFLDEQGVF